MITVILGPLSAADSHRAAFAAKAVKRLQTIVNDPRFDEKLKSARYVGRTMENDAGVLVEADSDLVREIIRGGKERKTSPDGTIELQVTFARLWSRSTLGYVVPPSPVITTNKRFFDLWEPDEDLSLAAHWMHEWMHVAGFRHGRNAKEDVAYSIGEFVTAVGRDLAREEGADKELLERLGRGYEEASKQSNEVDCPVFEDGVPEEYTRSDE